MKKSERVFSVNDEIRLIDIFISLHEKNLGKCVDCVHYNFGDDSNPKTENDCPKEYREARDTIGCPNYIEAKEDIDWMRARQEELVLMRGYES